MSLAATEGIKAKRTADRKPVKERVCAIPGCGEKFTSNLPHKKYCSLKCSTVAFNANIERNKKSKAKKKAEAKSSLDVSSAGKVVSTEVPTM
jgi:hypothetical protein